MTRAIIVVALLCTEPTIAMSDPLSPIAPYALPNPVLTPGVADPAATMVSICSIGADPPGVKSIAVKEWALGEYGISLNDETKYAIDRLIPIRLGGLSILENFWPQTLQQARTKDRIEAELQRRVCQGQLPLAEAQREIATDWVAAYSRYIGPLPAE